MRARDLDVWLIHGFHHYPGNDTGQTCLITEGGLERLSTYPVDELRVIGD